MKTKAFTLIELLVVVAIIGILAAVGVVAYNGYTNSAKKAVVKSNWKTSVKYLGNVVDGDIIKRMFTDDRTPIADQEFIEIDWKYEYDEYVKQDNSKFKTDSETEMQLVDLEIKYDDIIDKTEENEKYINDTNDWKSIYDSKKY